MGRHATDLVGQRFGRLLVLRRGKNRPQGGGKPRWVCLCDCGNEVEIPAARLVGGSNKSCGCYRRDRAGGLYKTHGKSKTPEYCMFYDARKRATARGVPCTITPEDIVIPKECPVLGIKLEAGKGLKSPFTPTLDCINPAKGYVPGNIAVVSWRFNKFKADMTIDELKKIAAWVGANL